jgi:monoamine oxidase
MYNGDEPSYFPSEPGLPPIQPRNPTNNERYNLLQYALLEANRMEDFSNVIKLLSPPPDITTLAYPGEFKDIKIGIIGGGLAGLSAAFELRKLGFDITVFEANPNRVGGRVFTYYFDKEKKYYGELGAMRIPVSHETTWHYINLFNLETRPFVQTNENAFIYVENTRVKNDAEGKNVMEEIYPKFNLTYRERQIPWTDLLNYALETPLLYMPTFIRKEILQVKPKYSPLITYWDYFNIRKVLEMSGLSEGAISLISSISPLVGSFFYYNYMEVLQESYTLDFTFLYEIIGGLSRLPLSLYYSITNPSPKEYKDIPLNYLGNVTWKNGTWVDGIYFVDSNQKVKLRYKAINNSEYMYETFDYVICAIPFSTLRNLEISPGFSNQKMQAIRELQYAPAQKTLFFIENRFWEKQGIIGGGSFTDLPITSIWYPSDHAECLKNKDQCSPDEPGVITASYNFTLDAIRLGNLIDNLRFDDIKRQIEKVHGLPSGYLDSLVKDFVTLNWNRYPWSLGGFCYFNPEQKRLFSYAAAVPEYNYRVFFAGEHISNKHAWQNSALQTGMIAANDIAKVCRARKKHK